MDLKISNEISKNLVRSQKPYSLNHVDIADIVDNIDIVDFVDNIDIVDVVNIAHTKY